MSKRHPKLGMSIRGGSQNQAKLAAKLASKAKGLGVPQFLIIVLIEAGCGRGSLRLTFFVLGNDIKVWYFTYIARAVMVRFGLT